MVGWGAMAMGATMIGATGSSLGTSRASLCKESLCRLAIESTVLGSLFLASRASLPTLCSAALTTAAWMSDLPDSCKIASSILTAFLLAKEPSSLVKSSADLASLAGATALVTGVIEGAITQQWSLSDSSLPQCADTFQKSPCQERLLPWLITSPPLTILSTAAALCYAPLLLEKAHALSQRVSVIPGVRLLVASAAAFASDALVRTRYPGEEILSTISGIATLILLAKFLPSKPLQRDSSSSWRATLITSTFVGGITGYALSELPHIPTQSLAASILTIIGGCQGFLIGKLGLEALNSRCIPPDSDS